MALQLSFEGMSPCFTVRPFYHQRSFGKLQNFISDLGPPPPYPGSLRRASSYFNRDGSPMELIPSALILPPFQFLSPRFQAPKNGEAVYPLNSGSLAVCLFFFLRKGLGARVLFAPPFGLFFEAGEVQPLSLWTGKVRSLLTFFNFSFRLSSPSPFLLSPFSPWPQSPNHYSWS